LSVKEYKKFAKDNDQNETIVDTKPMKLFILFALFSTTLHAASEFTLYVFKSSVGVDWTSPKDLAISIVKNEVYKYFNGNERLLGHVAVELKCGDKKLLTGMRATRGENRRMVLTEGSGYGVLFHVFPGALEKEQKLRTEIEQKQKSREVHSIRYKIKPEHCERMWQHYENHLKQKGEFNYGFPLNTLAGEGAGCSAFGVSFLQIAHLVNPEHLKAWSGNVWVPIDLIGPYNTKRYTRADEPTHKPDGGGKPITILDIVLSDKAIAWAKPGEGKYLEFIDPDTMFRWIETSAEKSPTPLPFKRLENSLELQLDLSGL
jgi:hypothetical protein